MNVEDHAPDDTTGPSHAAADARPVMLVRARAGTVGETARVVHLIPVPTDAASAVSALCGALIDPHRVETVTPGQGAPCERCLTSRPVLTAPLDPHGPPPPEPSPRRAAQRYHDWGWPVLLHRDRLWLDLGIDTDTLAVLIPTPLAHQVVTILSRHHSTPPVLAHPDTPEHHVLLCHERHDMALPWPPGVRPVTGTLLLPPSPTPHGPVTWTHLPGPDSLHACREIDLVAALRTALREPPPTAGPTHF